jgi:hypothetical protein
MGHVVAYCKLANLHRTLLSIVSFHVKILDGGVIHTVDYLGIQNRIHRETTALEF